MGTNLYTESCGAYSPVKLYRIDNTQQGNDKLILEIKASTTGYDLEDCNSASTKNISTAVHNLPWIQNIKFTLRQVFLPSGYPQSVSKDYIQYQIWDTVQAFASSITGALATEAVLKGVGVGNDKATTLAATMTWLLKNGSGMIGNIIFTWAKGTSLDHNCKKWRLFADALNDFAIFVDLINPLFPPQVVVLILSCSSVFRSIVGVAGGATRAAITQHQARNNNMADVSAKDGSQETLVNLSALIASLIVLPLVSGNSIAVWTLFVIFTCLHLFANYRAVRSLQLETLNRPRLLICIRQYLLRKTIPSIPDANLEESVIIGRGITDVEVCDFEVKLGVSLVDALESSKQTKKNLTDAIRKANGKPFIIIPEVHQKQINVILQENICPEEVVEAYFRSVAVAAVGSKFLHDEKLKDSMTPGITEMWLEFREMLLVKGFLLDRALIATGDWRAKWRVE